MFEPLNQIRHGIGAAQGPFLLIPDGFDQETKPVERFSVGIGHDLVDQPSESVRVSVPHGPHPISEPLRIRGSRRQGAPADDPIYRCIGVCAIEFFACGAEAALDGLAIGAWCVVLRKISFEDLQRPQFAQPHYAAVDGVRVTIFAD